MKSWFLSVMAVAGLVLALNHLGVDVSASLGTTLRSLAHFVNQPLL